MRNVAAVAGYENLPVHLLLPQLLVVGDTVALAGLVTYLLYLFTGRTGVVWWVVGLYFVYYVFYTWLLFFTDPVGLRVGPVRTSFEYAGPDAGLLVPLFVMLVYVPQLGAAVAYATPLGRVEDASRRFRIRWVSTSILVWSLGNMGLILASKTGRHVVELVFQVLILVAPIGAILGYYPPAWARHRWRGRSAGVPPQDGIVTSK